ncbi:hypothetical protein HYQ45_009655 [Verticillium longisporum]|uniref:Uncharacterized protein n=3 Tax=Verticillium longisporum TaxID=100787 RepID=A0A8I2ZHQ6_VERLO|nr:hypothetical protein HYQ45_009655 [Verticillium longisporum]
MPSLACLIYKRSSCRRRCYLLFCFLIPHTIIWSGLIPSHTFPFFLFRAVLVVHFTPFFFKDTLNTQSCAHSCLVSYNSNSPKNNRSLPIKPTTLPTANMKFSTIIAAAMATFAAAAPVADSNTAASTPSLQSLESRAVFDLSQLNGLQGFQNVDLNYLLRLNSVDLNLFAQLGQVQNFNLLNFQHLFNVQQFDVLALLQLQQLQTLLALQGQGVFNGLNLVDLRLGGLNFGLVGGIQGVNLAQFIGGDVIPQVAQIAQQPTNFVVIAKN